MIYGISRELEKRLRANRFPLSVIYGPERLKRAAPTDLVVVVERDRTQSDAYAGPMGTQANPHKVARRGLATMVTVWAKSSLIGAQTHEHEELCEQVVDAIYVHLADVVRESVHVDPDFSDARYMDPKELNGPESWPGVAYVIRLRVPRGVLVRDYKGAGLPEGSPSGITTEVRVRRNADDPPEVVEI